MEIICDRCKQEKETHRFYWGFFSHLYDETKWCYLCDECIQDFLKASNVYRSDNNDLWLLYREIETNMNQDNEGLQRIQKIRKQKRW